MPIEMIGRYEVKSEIGRGGMATVYSAYDPRFRREVAIKVLPPQFQHDPQFRSRFEREALIIAALEHPAIVPVHDYGSEGDFLYLVMRFMAGGSLADRLKGGAITVTEAGRIFNRLAPGLDAAHQKGIIHRDLKPANILFDEWGEPYLSDFGIAKLVESSTTALTAAGGLVGTPAYMSPEQVVATGDLDGRSDLYAMGAILFEMLTGEQPYEANTPLGLAFKHVNEPVPRILDKNPTLPAGAQAVIDKAMAKNPDERYQNTTMLADATMKLGHTDSSILAPSAAAGEALSIAGVSEVAPQPAESTPEPTEFVPQPAGSTPEVVEFTPQPPEPVPDLTEVETGPAEVTSEPFIEAPPIAISEEEPEAPVEKRPNRLSRVPLWGWLLGGLGCLAIVVLVGGAIAAGAGFIPGLLESPTAIPTATRPRVVQAEPEPTSTAPSPTEPAPPEPEPAEPAPEDEPPIECLDPLGCVEVGPDHPILLGTQLALEGPVADLGLDSLRGVELAIRFREQILGHPIELIVENDSCEKDLGRAVTEQFVSNPGIVAIIGPTCSSVALETAEIVSVAGYVMVSPSNTTPGLTVPDQHMPGYLRTAPNDIIQGLAMAEFAFNELGVRKAAVIHEEDIYTMNLAHIFASVFEGMGGEIVALVPVVQGEAEAEVALMEMAELNAEFIFFPVFSDLAAVITNLARGVEGLEDTILATADGAQTPLFLEQAGLNAQGVIASSPDIQLDSPFYAEVFLPAYVDTYGMEPPAPFHAHAFDATMIVLNAIENVAQRREDGSLLIGRLALREALYATQEHDGLSGVITCNEFGDCGDTRISISEVQNGEFVRIWP